MSDDEQVWEDLGYGALPPEGEVTALRAREPRHREGASWSKPTIATVALCLVPSCKKPVEVTEEAMGMMETFNAILSRRGEAPLRLNEIFNCGECAVDRAAASMEKSEARRAKTTAAIRLLKGLEPSTRETERDAREYLERVMGSGYVRDLLSAIQERKRDGKRPQTRKEEL
jgi:hypothetical protein